LPAGVREAGGGGRRVVFVAGRGARRQRGVRRRHVVDHHGGGGDVLGVAAVADVHLDRVSAPLRLPGRVVQVAVAEAEAQHPGRQRERGRGGAVPPEDRHDVVIRDAQVGERARQGGRAVLLGRRRRQAGDVGGEVLGQDVLAAGGEGTRHADPVGAGGGRPVLQGRPAAPLVGSDQLARRVVQFEARRQR